MITCTPYGINTHRLLVRGEYDPNFDFSSEEYSFTYESIKNDWLWMILVSRYVLALWALSSLRGRKKKAKRRKLENEETK